MIDRVSTQVLPNGAIRYGIYNENGDFLRYEYIKPEDEPLEIGTPYNKVNVLTDETALQLDPDNPPSNVNEAFDKTSILLNEHSSQLSNIESGQSSHIGNTILHTNTTERNLWNGVITNYSAHNADNVRHISAGERAAWNACPVAAYQTHNAVPLVYAWQNIGSAVSYYTRDPFGNVVVALRIQWPGGTLTPTLANVFWLPPSCRPAWDISTGVTISGVSGRIFIRNSGSFEVSTSVNVPAAFEWFGSFIAAH